MTANVETEVIPLWYINKWKNVMSQTDSKLEYWLDMMLKDWARYEADHKQRSREL